MCIVMSHADDGETRLAFNTIMFLINETRPPICRCVHIQSGFNRSDTIEACVSHSSVHIRCRAMHPRVIKESINGAELFHIYRFLSRDFLEKHQLERPSSGFLWNA